MNLPEYRVNWKPKHYVWNYDNKELKLHAYVFQIGESKYQYKLYCTVVRKVMKVGVESSLREAMHTSHDLLGTTDYK